MYIYLLTYMLQEIVKHHKLCKVDQTVATCCNILRNIKIRKNMQMLQNIDFVANFANTLKHICFVVCNMLEIFA